MTVLACENRPENLPTSPRDDPVASARPDDGLTRPPRRTTPGLVPASVYEPGAVEIVPASPYVRNCFPFSSDYWTFMGFMYRNIPPFEMKVGDRFAFDLGATNNVDIRRNVYFARANKNPSAPSGSSQGIRAVAWVQVASTAQLPTNPRGNGTVGDFELEFTAEAPFSFPGGGLIVAFDPGGIDDPGCEQVLIGASGSDASGLFYARFYLHPLLDAGVLDSDGWSTGSIGALVIGVGGGSCAAAVEQARAAVGALPGAGARLGNAMLDAVEAGNDRAIEALRRVTLFLARFGLIDESTEDFLLSLADLCGDLE